MNRHHALKENNSLIQKKRTAMKTSKIVNIALAVVSLILILVIKELLSRDIINDGVAWALGAGVFVFFFAAKRIIYKKYPSLAPPKQETEDIDLSNTDDMVELPRTVGSTILEIVLAAMFAVACYKTWTVDKTLYIFLVPLAITAGGMLMVSYYPDSKEGEIHPKASAADIVKSRRMRVRSVALALFSLAIVFLPWKMKGTGNFAFIGCILYVALRLVFSLVIKDAPNQQNGAGKFNINEVRVPHTLAALAFEAVTILILIGTWYAAWRTRLLAGKSIMDLTIIQMIFYSVLAVIALVIAYCPRWMNRSLSFTNSRQLIKNIELYRILAIGCALAAMLVVYHPFKGTIGVMDFIARHFFVVFLFIELYYRNLIRNEMKDNETDK